MQELSRLDSTCQFFPKTAFSREVVLRLRPALALRRPRWPQLLWRERERIRAIVGGWGDDAAAVATFLR